MLESEDFCCAVGDPDYLEDSGVRLFGGLPRAPGCIIYYLFAYLDLGPLVLCILGLGHIYFAGMPPKKRVAEIRGEDEVEREGAETELTPGSPASSASYASSRSCPSVTTEQLEKILEANHKSMTALLASLSHSSSAGSSRASSIKIPKWSDDEIPFEYFVKFEKAVTHNGIEKSAWGQLLPDDFEAVKATLLESLGDTPASADRKWWSLSRQSGEEPGSFYLRVRALGLRRLHGLVSKNEITEKMIL